MTIARILGLEHLPQGQLTGAWNTAFGLGFAGMTIGARETAGYAHPKLEINGSKLKFGRVASATGATGSALQGSGIVGIKFNTLFGEKSGIAYTAIKGFTIGYRLSKGPDVSFLNTSIAVGALHESAPASFGSTGLSGITLSPTGNWQFQYRNTSTTVLTAANDIYVEHVYTVTTSSQGSHQIYIDGQLVYNLSVASLTIANLWSTGYIYYGMTGIMSNTSPDEQNFATISDIYAILDDGTAGDPYPVGSRLGPIMVQRLPALAVASDDWVGSDGSALKDVLNLRRDNDGTTNHTLVPTANSGAAGTGATVSFDTTSLGNLANIAALQVCATAGRPNGQAANLKLTALSNTTVETEKSFTDLTVSGTVVQSDRNLMTLNRLLGAKITKAAVGNFRLAVTPT